MAKKARYIVKYRRKREGKTNYRRRLELLKSGRHRLVIRPSNKYIGLQIVKYDPDGDLIIAASHSNELKKFGWKFSMGNIPAAYLAGLLCGYRGVSKGVKDAVLDLGLYPSLSGSRIYTALNGVVDAKLNVPHDPSIFPDEARVMGEHISADVSKNFNETKKSIIDSISK